MKKLFVALTIVSLAQCIVADFSFAERRIVQSKRANPNGDGIEQAPLMTISYDPTIAAGETELVQVAVTDHDGNPVTVEYYVNNSLKFKQAAPPYLAFVGPDLHSGPPFTVHIIAEDDYGNKSRAALLIRQTGLSDTYDCTLDGSDIKVEGTELTPKETNGSGFTMEFEGNNLENTLDPKENVEVTLVFTTQASKKASGTLSYIRKNGTKSTFVVEGSVEFDSDGLTIKSATLADQDNSVTITCK